MKCFRNVTFELLIIALIFNCLNQIPYNRIKGIKKLCCGRRQWSHTLIPLYYNILCVILYTADVCVEHQFFFYLIFCVCVLSLLPLRWILVQPTHLDDGSEGRAVFFSGCRQFARDGQINTALLVADAPILPLCRPLE